MKILNSSVDLDSFLAKLKHARRKGLFIDYDGTLAPFHSEPGKAVPYPGVPELLSRLMEMPDTRLVIISGRWTEDLLPLLQLDRRPEIWGSHGLERLRPDGSYEVASMDEKSLDGIVVADEWVERQGLADRCEKKPGCLAVHWRGLDEPSVRRIRDVIDPMWSLIAEGWGLRLNEFDGGVELQVPGRNKGDAIETLLNEMGSGTVAAYLGDDITDEDAFKAIKAHGVGVLVREEFRPTAADIWITPPDELMRFLRDWMS